MIKIEQKENWTSKILKAAKLVSDEKNNIPYTHKKL